MNPLDLMLWALAAVIAIACFVLIVLLLSALVRGLFRKRPPQKSANTFIIEGTNANDVSANVEKNGRRLGEQR
ncbi:hypothetical protein [Microbacterium sp. NPDC078849]|uniref:hypothetical protein n=1 Tax=unclassified Microbacterium TaxID=2609290 RepID=UPI00344D60A2